MSPVLLRCAQRILSPGSLAAALVFVSTLASAPASAVQSAELYRTQALFYGRLKRASSLRPVREL